MYAKVQKKLNKRLETKLGYSMVQQREAGNDNQGLVLKIWNNALQLLWWIVAPTLVFFVFFAIYLFSREMKNRYSFYSKSKLSSHRSRLSNSVPDGLKKPLWIEVMERSTGRMYYVHKTSGRVQWNRPSSYVQYSGIDPKFNNNPDYKQSLTKRGIHSISSSSIRHKYN